MILHWDGSWPLLMIVLMVIYFFIYRKEQKENRIIQKECESLEMRCNEIKKLSNTINNGQTTINKSNFKNLKEEDFKFYADIYSYKNVKFV